MWIEQVMSGDFSRLLSRQYWKNSEVSGNCFWRFCHGLVVLAVAMLVLNTGSIESTALAKAKYFSGKSKISRSHHSSKRHQTRTHYKGQRYNSRKSAHHRLYTKRRGTHKRYAKYGRYHNYSYRLAGYRDSSVINVRKTLLNKRAGNTRLSYRYRGYNKHHRNRYGNIRRVVMTGSMVAVKSDITRHVVPEDPRGMTAIYYNAKLCKQDYDCVMRVGNRRSSPKIIVVGSKRDEANHVESNGVKIIHPPL